MNLTIILIAAFLPLFPLLFLILRSRSFGKGSRRIFFKLLFLGILAAVPAFLMAVGGLGAAAVIFRLFPEDAAGNEGVLISVLMRYVLAGALIEEAWKHFILRVSTWKQMTMETVGDGIAAAAVVGTAFSAVLYVAWQAAYHVLPPDLEILRRAMPDFLSAGPVAAFIHALLFIPSHFGYAGLMGALYGFAKGSEQKQHSHRAGFMLTVSFLLAVLVHGVIESLTGYGFVTGQKLWLILGFAAEAVLAFIVASALVAVRDSSLEAALGQNEPETPVDFADSEEFADFAEAEGNPDAEAGGSSQQNLLEYAGAAAEAENAGTGFGQEDLETGSPFTETGTGGLPSSSESWGTETGADSFGGLAESGSADTEAGAGSLETSSESGSRGAEDLPETAEQSEPEGQDSLIDMGTGTGFGFTAGETEAGTAPEGTTAEPQAGTAFEGISSEPEAGTAFESTTAEPEAGTALEGTTTTAEPEAGTAFEGTASEPGAGTAFEGTEDVPEKAENVNTAGLSSGPSSGYGWVSDIQPASPETPDISSGGSANDAAAEPEGQESTGSEKDTSDGSEKDGEAASDPGKGLFSRFRKMIDGDFS